STSGRSIDYARGSPRPRGHTRSGPKHSNSRGTGRSLRHSPDSEALQSPPCLVDTASPRTPIERRRDSGGQCCNSADTQSPCARSTKHSIETGQGAHPVSLQRSAHSSIEAWSQNLIEEKDGRATRNTNIVDEWEPRAIAH